MSEHLSFRASRQERKMTERNYELLFVSIFAAGCAGLLLSISIITGNNKLLEELSTVLMRALEISAVSIVAVLATQR